MVNTCPHCGTPVEPPMLFSQTRQQILNYIWRNPGCTRPSIEKAIYGKFRVTSNVFAVHLSQIRKVLTERGFVLVNRGGHYNVARLMEDLIV